MSTLTFAEFADRVKDSTILDLHFTRDDAPKYVIPEPLSDRPPASRLRDNTWLGPLVIVDRARFTGRRTGYDLWLDAAFDEESFREGARG